MNRVSPFHTIAKKAKRGFRGYPIATIAFYGPNKKVASKVAIGIVKREGDDPEPLEKWLSDAIDVRHNRAIANEVIAFVRTHGVASVVITDGVGCQHEEGTDYPLGKPCPKCPFWKGRDRFSGEMEH